MTDINAPIQIPCELNVPETTNRNEQIEPIKPKSAAPAILPQSADEKLYPKHRLQKEAKSQSMFNFSARERPTSEPKQKTEKAKEIVSKGDNDEESDDGDNDDDDDGNNDEAPPTITLSPPSAKYCKSADRRSTSSLDRIDCLREPSEMGHISASTNEMKLSINRNRANSVATINHSEREDDEFDELGPNGQMGSQLRIRSSIVSLFGRMGKMRRTSSISQNSTHGNGVNGTENSEHTSTFRALPQIAATKILRAFSYVGKLSDKPTPIRNVLNLFFSSGHSLSIQYMCFDCNSTTIFNSLDFVRLKNEIAFI